MRAVAGRRAVREAERRRVGLAFHYTHVRALVFGCALRQGCPTLQRALRGVCGRWWSEAPGGCLRIRKVLRGLGLAERVPPPGVRFPLLQEDWRGTLVPSLAGSSKTPGGALS